MIKLENRRGPCIGGCSRLTKRGQECRKCRRRRAHKGLRLVRRSARGARS